VVPRFAPSVTQQWRPIPRFYEHFDFEPSPTDELHLMLVLKDARRAGF